MNLKRIAVLVLLVALLAFAVGAFPTPAVDGYGNLSPRVSITLRPTRAQV